MPDNMSEERRKIIKAFGGELICTPAAESLNGCLEKLKELKREIPNLFIPGQFVNPDNPEIRSGACQRFRAAGAGAGTAPDRGHRRRHHGH